MLIRHHSGVLIYYTVIILNNFPDNDNVVVLCDDGVFGQREWMIECVLPSPQSQTPVKSIATPKGATTKRIAIPINGSNIFLFIGPKKENGLTLSAEA